jgi:hypothetical protein
MLYRFTNGIPKIIDNDIRLLGTVLNNPDRLITLVPYLRACIVYTDFFLPAVEYFRQFEPGKHQEQIIHIVYLDRYPED